MDTPLTMARFSAGSILSTTETKYNAKGQVTRTIAADGQISDRENDSLGRQTATIGHAVPAELVGLTQHAGKNVRLRSETEFDDQGRVQKESTVNSPRPAPIPASTAARAAHAWSSGASPSPCFTSK